MLLALISALLGAGIWLVWDASLALFSRKAEQRPAARSPIQEITVILCVRDGGAHLQAWLEGARAWGVPVVVVDDGSAIAVAPQVERHPGFRCIRLENSRPGKKDAVEAGLALVETDWVALTDVDCRPSPGWVKALREAAGERAELVVGVSLPVLGKVSAVPFVDAVSVARRYAAAVGAGVPYMGVGRNLAYHLPDFPGFDRHRAWASGDDDLLVQDWPRKEGLKRMDQIAFTAHNVPTFAPESLAAWRRMKLRHLSTGTAYRPRTVALLALPAVAALLWGAGATALWALWWRMGGGHAGPNETVGNRAVLHIALWIVHGAGGIAWLLHVLTFRAFATRCGLTGLAVWGGVLQPVAFLEQVLLTARAAWASGFGLKSPPQNW